MPPFWPFSLQYQLPKYHRHNSNKKFNSDDENDSLASSSSSTTIRSQISLSTRLLTSSWPSSKNMTLSKYRKINCGRQRKHKKSVTFNPQVTQHDYIHVLDMTSDERTNAWYNRHEMSEISMENRKTIRWMMYSFDAAIDAASTVFCSRGLECKTPTGYRLYLRHRMDAMGACLRFQASEWQHGRKISPESMAEVYGVYTRHSMEIAQEAAKMDRESLLLLLQRWPCKTYTTFEKE